MLPRGHRCYGAVASPSCAMSRSSAQCLSGCSALRIRFSSGRVPRRAFRAIHTVERTKVFRMGGANWRADPAWRKSCRQCPVSHSRLACAAVCRVLSNAQREFYSAVHHQQCRIGQRQHGSRHTASFAVHAIRRWWRIIGRQRYPTARHLMITADGGSSNGYRVRLWKVELQKLASITICHLPPGTSAFESRNS